MDPKYIEDSMDTPDTGSFMHLHLGIDAEGLEGLDIHYSVRIFTLAGTDNTGTDTNFVTVSVMVAAVVAVAVTVCFWTWLRLRLRFRIRLLPRLW